ncbi:MAG: DUF4397 domain-containing protein [Sphingobacteriaceae bacterium]
MKSYLMRKKIIDVVFIAALFLCSACGQKNDIGPSNLQSKLLVVQAAPDVEKIDLYLAGIKQNRNPIFYSGRLGYFGIRSGKQLATIRIPVTNLPLDSGTVSIDPKENYTLFFTGISSSSTYPLDVIFIPDSANLSPSSGRAKLRFVNASPSSQTFEVFANNTLAFSASPYKQVTDYVEFPAGSWNFKINLTKSTTITNDSTVADVQRVELQDGRLYTLYTRGIPGRLDEQALGAFVVAGTNTIF